MNTLAQHATTYWEGVAQKSKWGQYLAEIEKTAILKGQHLAGQPESALEIGCEGGRWSKLLSDLGWSMICTDINKASLESCQRRIPTARCVLVNPDDSRLPCDTESVRLALCIEVGPVITSNWFPREVSRILPKGGVIVGVFWNRWSWRGLLLHSLATLRGRYSWYPLAFSRWKKRLCEEGFTFAYEEGFAWPPFSRVSNSPLIPAAIRTEEFLGLRRLIHLSPWIVFVAQRN